MSEAQIFREVASLGEKLDTVATDVAAIKARTEVLEEIRSAESSAMWGKAGGLDDRLRTVERDYATKAEIADANRRILEVEKQVSRMVGWGAAALVLIQLLGIGGIAAVLKLGS